MHDPVPGEVFRGAVAPGDGEGIDAAIRGGAHVGGGVADQQGVGPVDAGGGEHFFHDFR